MIRLVLNGLTVFLNCFATRWEKQELHNPVDWLNNHQFVQWFKGSEYITNFCLLRGYRTRYGLKTIILLAWKKKTKFIISPVFLLKYNFLFVEICEVTIVRIIIPRFITGAGKGHKYRNALGFFVFVSQISKTCADFSLTPTWLVVWLHQSPILLFLVVFFFVSRLLFSKLVLFRVI